MSLDWYCSSFLKIDDWYELKEETVCLCAIHGRKQCLRNNIQAIVHVTETTTAATTIAGQKTLYLNHYSNSFRGHTESNVHAEENMIADKKLETVLLRRPVLTTAVTTGMANNSDLQVDLYITYQPCHHSGGGRKLHGHLHQTSCTDRVLKWFKERLQLRGIRLTIWCPNIYRAHWVDSKLFEKAADVSIFEPRALVARQGLVKLMADIPVKAMTPERWQLLMSWFGPKLQASIPADFWPRRHKRDRDFQAFLDGLTVTGSSHE